MSPLEKLPLPFGFLQFPEEAPLFCTQLICKIRKTTRSPRKKGALDDFLQCCGDPSRRLGNGHCLKYEFIIFHYFSSFVSFPCVVLLVLPDSGMACLFAVSLFFFFFLVCIFFFFFSCSGLPFITSLSRSLYPITIQQHSASKVS